jgi:cell volume regulation protein A
MNVFEKPLIMAAILIILSVIASKASSRFGIPALLAFLMIGMGSGVHGLDELPLPSFDFAQRLGIFALVFILFSGGMSTRLQSVRVIFRPALILSTVGVVISTLCVGLFANLLLGFSLLDGFLLGATVSSTDVAAVFTVLRSKKVSLKEGIAPLLEFESALNDPMTVFLGVGLLGMITQKSQSLIGLVPLFFQQMIFGALLGWGFGKALVFIINRIKLEFEGLYPVLSIGGVLFTYAMTQFVGGSGFLAVYVAGIVLGNENLLHKKSLVHFHEGIAWLMQIAMFLTMGLLVDPAELVRVAPPGIAISLFLVFVARPASVFLCFLKGRFNWREKVMVSWAGLRGAVPIILATYPFVVHIPRASAIFNLVFFVTFISVLLQGATIPLVARLLKVDTPLKEKFRFPIEFNPMKNLRNKVVEITVPADSPNIGKALLDLSLPKEVLIILIERAGDVVMPRGGTHLSGGDTLLVMAEDVSSEDLARMICFK